MEPVPTSAPHPGPQNVLEGRCTGQQSLKRKPSGTASDENVDPPQGWGQSWRGRTRPIGQGHWTEGAGKLLRGPLQGNTQIIWDFILVLLFLCERQEEGWISGVIPEGTELWFEIVIKRWHYQYPCMVKSVYRAWIPLESLDNKDVANTALPFCTALNMKTGNLSISETPRWAVTLFSLFLNPPCNFNLKIHNNLFYFQDNSCHISLLFPTTDLGTVS